MPHDLYNNMKYIFWGRFFCSLGWSWNGWWITDCKGYRHHYLTAMWITTSPNDPEKVFTLILGPLSLAVTIISASHFQ